MISRHKRRLLSWQILNLCELQASSSFEGKNEVITEEILKVGATLDSKIKKNRVLKRGAI
jgi:hypothetical protein